MKILSTVTIFSCIRFISSFAPQVIHRSSSLRNFAFTSSDWAGEVVSNEGGVIQGCAITPVGEEPVTEWIVQIDG